MAVGAAEEECSSVKLRSSSSSSSSSRSAHYLAKCVLKGSAILQVLYAHLRSPSSPDIVFGKETSIELVVMGEDGVLQSICEQPVFGTIRDIVVLRYNDQLHAPNSQMLGKDLLVTLSDSGKLVFLRFCDEMHRFFPVTHLQLSKPGNSTYQLGRMLSIDSSSCYIAASAYEDRLALFSISSQGPVDLIDKRITYPPETERENNLTQVLQEANICGTIWSMCFISKDTCQQSRDHSPILAILHNRRGEVLNELMLLGWNTRENAVHVLSQHVGLGPLAYNIAEVPHYSGYVFLFRLGDAILMDLRDAYHPVCVHKTSLNVLPSTVEELNFLDESFRVHDDDEGIFNVAARALLELRDHGMDISRNEDDPMNIDGDSGSEKLTSKHVCSWSWEPGNLRNPRMVFSIDTGELFMIEVSVDSDGIKVDLSDCVYKCQPCKSLLWVEGGFLTATVDVGDGMVLKLENEKLLYRSTIQNIAPILDMSVVDYHDEKNDQMFACCGVGPEGSLRIIRGGISVDKLLRTAPIYQGITGTWTIRRKVNDLYHSFLVLSFVEETRVLSVGLSFIDVTDSVGFLSDVCTLGCGLVLDDFLVQIHHDAVRLCLPTQASHPEGISLPSPIYKSWYPGDLSISLGSVGHNLIVIATSCPCFLIILGVRELSKHDYEIYEMHRVRLQNELSCISIPKKRIAQRSISLNEVDNSCTNTLPGGIIISTTFVIGTRKPSVEILSFVPNEGLKVVAIGTISLTQVGGATTSGCVPQDVRIVLGDRFYVLSGLRNGMLLRFEWPPSSPPCTTELSCYSQMSFNSSSELIRRQFPISLQLIAVRRIGVTPVFLVPFSDNVDSDMIALSDRPWFLQTARHSISYASIPFQPSTHVTPVCSAECPNGILFVAENSLHLVEMVHSKRLNVQKFHLGGTPRRVLYHCESRMLIVMRGDTDKEAHSSDICCVDPLSGLMLSSFKLELGEAGKSMALVKVGNEEVVVVGTSLTSGRAVMPSGEPESTSGRIIVLRVVHLQNSDSGSMTLSSKVGSSQRTSPFREIVGYATEQLSNSSLCSSPDDTSSDGLKLEETDLWQLRLSYSNTWHGVVLAVYPYLDHYFLASAGNSFYVCGFRNDNPQHVKRLAVGRTRFMITSLTAHATRIAVGDCRDGILFFSYQEDARKLEQLYCDPVQRLVADCILMDTDTAFVSDRKGGVAVLSCSNSLEEKSSPECNLTLCCSYYIGEIAMRIRKGTFSYKLPADDLLGATDCFNTVIDPSRNSIMVTTLLGSIIVFFPLSREEYELLEAVQDRLAIHPLTAPVLGNDHNEFRSRGSPARVPKILDGDMLAQFLELTSLQQEAVLSLPLCTPDKTIMGLKQTFPIPISGVVQLLERVHYALS